MPLTTTYIKTKINKTLKKISSFLCSWKVAKHYWTSSP